MSAPLCMAFTLRNRHFEDGRSCGAPAAVMTVSRATVYCGTTFQAASFGSRPFAAAGTYVALMVTAQSPAIGHRSDITTSVRTKAFEIFMTIRFIGSPPQSRRRRELSAESGLTTESGRFLNTQSVF